MFKIKKPSPVSIAFWILAVVCLLFAPDFENVVVTARTSLAESLDHQKHLIDIGQAPANSISFTKEAILFFLDYMFGIFFACTVLYIRVVLKIQSRAGF